jgi:benzoate membrane transport protein
MTSAPILNAITAAFVGCGGSVAIVLAAAEATGATAAQTASWFTALCLAMAATTMWLSLRHRLPIITAWSTPGAALIAASPAGALTIETAVGAFFVAAALVVATSLVSPLARIVERLPMPIASAMLAGVLLRLVTSPFEALAQPGTAVLVLPMLALFLVWRLVQPMLAVIGVLVAGTALAGTLGQVGPLPPLEFASLTPVLPRFDPAVALGLGVPLYLVTMASQNLAGFAVLRASGYENVPTTSILRVTGIASFVSAFAGAHTSNLAAISAAICTGPDTHPDPSRRWLAGPPYALCYLAFASIGPMLVAVFAALPPVLLKTVAGIALASPMLGALTQAFSGTHEKFAPGLAFAITASGVALLGVGAAFWGLAAGLLVHWSDTLYRRPR